MRRAPYDAPPTPGAVLQHAREQAMIGQVELARRSGVPASTISRIERGRRSPRWEVLTELLAALGLQPVLDVEPLDDHLLRELADEASRPAAEWFEDLHHDGRSVIRLALALPLAVDGTLAARMHGLPMPIGDIELVLPRTALSAAELEDRCARETVYLYPADEPDTYVAHRPERRLVIRCVDDPPPVTDLRPPAPLSASRPDPGRTIKVVDVGHLRLDARERRLLAHALRRQLDPG